MTAGISEKRGRSQLRKPGHQTLASPSTLVKIAIPTAPLAQAGRSRKAEAIRDPENPPSIGRLFTGQTPLRRCGDHRAAGESPDRCNQRNGCGLSRGILTPRETIMRIATIIFATAFALSTTFAFAHSSHRSHHRMHHARSSSPNGTAGGASSLSGTGSSQFGGSVPGNTGKN
jgi:hypothetical protein